MSCCFSDSSDKPVLNSPANKVLNNKNRVDIKLSNYLYPSSTQLIKIVSEDSPALLTRSITSTNESPALLTRSITSTNESPGTLTRPITSTNESPGTLTRSITSMNESPNSERRRTYPKSVTMLELYESNASNHDIMAMKKHYITKFKSIKYIE